VLNLFIPPLRERRKDVLPLIDRMLSETEGCSAKFSISDQCKNYLESYYWPGNVRELKNFCERVSAICDQDELDIDLATTLLRAGSVENPESGVRQDVPELRGQSATPAEEIIPIGILDDPEGLRDLCMRRPAYKLQPKNSGFIGQRCGAA